MATPEEIKKAFQENAIQHVSGAENPNNAGEKSDDRALWKKALSGAGTALDAANKYVAMPIVTEAELRREQLTNSLDGVDIGPVNLGQLADNVSRLPIPGNPLAAGAWLTGPGDETDEERSARYQAARDAGYFDAYEKLTDGAEGWKTFALEATHDPLNLVGAGLPLKLRHARHLRHVDELGDVGAAARTLTRGDRLLDAAVGLDTIAERIFAAPITVPKWIGQKTVGKTKIGQAFALSARGKLYAGKKALATLMGRAGVDESTFLGSSRSTLLQQETEGFRNALFQTAPDDPTGLTVRLSDNAGELLDDMSDYQILRQMYGDENQHYARLLMSEPEVTAKLVDRGIFTVDGKLTPRGVAHVKLDDTLRSAGMGYHERDSLHLLLEFVAEGLPQRQASRAPNEALGQIPIGSDDFASAYQSADDVYSRIDFQIGDTTAAVRDGASVVITIGPDANLNKVTGEIFEKFVLPGMPMSDRLRVLTELGVPPEVARTAYTPEMWEGVGERVINMIRHTDITTDEALQGLFNQFRQLLRLTPETRAAGGIAAEEISQAGAESIIDTLSQQPIGERRTFLRGVPEPDVTGTQAELPFGDISQPSPQPPPTPTASPPPEAPVAQQLPMDLDSITPPPDVPGAGVADAVDEIPVELRNNVQRIEDGTLTGWESGTPFTKEDYGTKFVIDADTGEVLLPVGSSGRRYGWMSQSEARTLFPHRATGLKIQTYKADMEAVKALRLSQGLPEKHRIFNKLTDLPAPTPRQPRVRGPLPPDPPRVQSQMDLDIPEPPRYQSELGLNISDQLDPPTGQSSPLGFPDTPQTPSSSQPGVWEETRRLTSEEANLLDAPQGFQRRYGPEGPVEDPLALTQLAPDASFDDYLGRLADDNGLRPEQFTEVRQALDPIIQQNEEFFQAGALMGNDAFDSNIIAAAQNPARAKMHLSAAMDAINLPMQAAGFRNPILSKIANFLPGVPDMKRVGPATSFGKITDTVLKKDRQKIEEVLQSEEVQKAVVKWQKNAQIVEDALNRIREQIPIANITDTTTFSELLRDRRVTKLFTDDQKKALEAAVGEMGGLRGSAAREARFQSTVMEAWDKHLRKELGIKPLRKSAARKAFETATRAWREQALMSVRYFAANGLDMVVRGAVHGVNGVNFVGARGAAQEKAVRLGIDQVPISLRTGDLMDMSAATGQLETTRLGGQSGLGSIVGVVSDSGQRVVDRFVGWNRRMAFALEDSARMAAWTHGMEEFLKTRVQKRFLNHTARRLRQSGVSAADTQKIVKELREQGVMYSPDDVRNWIMRGATGEPNPQLAELATELSNVWKQSIDEASIYGENLAKNIHFDIGDERAIEAALGLHHILPFHTWATRNIPFYLNTVAAHPWIYRTVNHYNNATEGERRDFGLTQRFEDKMLLPKQANGLVSLLLGPGHHAYNPMIVFSLMDQFKGGYEPDPSDSSIPMLGSALNALGSVGFKPAPWVDIPLNIAGVYGATDPYSLSRHGDFVADSVEALTGVQALDQRPTQRATRALRNLNPLVPEVDTVSNSQFMDRAINQRLREMSEEATGDARNPAYMVAMTDPENPLYQEARAHVVSRNARRGAQGLISPFPYTSASDAEVNAWQATPDTGDMNLSPVAIRLMQQWNHPATSFWGIPDNRVESEIRAAQEIPYEAREALVTQLGLQGYNDYVAWLKTLPQGRDRSVKAFLRDR